MFQGKLKQEMYVYRGKKGLAKTLTIGASKSNGKIRKKVKPKIAGYALRLLSSFFSLAEALLELRFGW